MKKQSNLSTLIEAKLFQKPLGAAGVQGLNKLAGFMLAAELQSINGLLTNSQSTQLALQGVHNVLTQQNPFR